MSTVPNTTCRKCGSARVFQAGRYRCRVCLTRSEADRRARLDPRTKEAERVRDNANRNVRREQWTPDKRASENARAAAWRIANADAYRAGTRDWYVRNAEHARAAKLAEYYAAPEKFYARNLLRKARILNAVCEHGPKCVTDAFLSELYAKACVYCSDPAEAADHLIPLARGGIHCVDNLVPACGSCNSRKSARDPFEWLMSLT